MARKLSADTVAIIDAIKTAQAVAQTTADAVSAELVNHTQHDDERFEALTKLVESIAKDVQSLLASRTFVRGAWWAVGGLATAVSAVVAIVVAYLKG